MVLLAVSSRFSYRSSCAPVPRLPAVLVAIAILSIAWQQAAAAQFTVGPEFLRIGSASRADGPVFGEIVSAQWTADGRIISVDARFNDIRLFDRRGRLIQRTAGPGLDPGFFHVPIAATVSAHMLLVLDAATKRITAYRIRDTLEFIWAQPIEESGSDMCAVRNQVFVLGTGDSLIRQFDLSERGLLEVHSFGLPFSSDPVLRTVLSSGRIACGPDGVAAASALLPFVWMYDLSGTPIRRLEIADFHPFQHERLAGGAVRTQPAPGGATNRIASLVMLGTDTLVVQIATLPTRDGAHIESLRTYLILGDRFAPTTVRLPYRVRAALGSRVLGSRSHPYPVLSISTR